MDFFIGALLEMTLTALVPGIMGYAVYKTLPAPIPVEEDR